MLQIEIKQTDETKTLLSKYPNEFRKSLVEGFRKSVKLLESKVKQSFGKSGKPKVRSGALRSSIYSTVIERSNYLTALLKSDLIYAAPQEFGAVILPKQKPYMRFTIYGRWVTMKRIVLPARPYMQPTINENQDLVNTTIENQIVGDLK